MEITQQAPPIPPEQEDDNELSNPDSKQTKEEDSSDSKETKEEEETTVVEDNVPDLSTLSNQIDEFLAVLDRFKDAKEDDLAPPEVPEAAVDQFVFAVENEIVNYESDNGEEKLPLLDAINRVSKLHSELSGFSQDGNYYHVTNKSGCVLHHAMCFLEDEFFSLLETRQHEASPKEANSGEEKQTYPKETVERMRDIAAAMIAAGYGTECWEVFSSARSKAAEAALASVGYEKASIDDVVKMTWESLEGAIATWIKSFRHFISVVFPAEHDLCNQVFSGHPEIATTLLHSLARGVLLHLLIFPDAVAISKRSAEKLFKVLDIYDALREASPTIDSLLLPPSLSDSTSYSSLSDDLSSVLSRLGEAAVSIFSDLESSVKSDSSKSPVPGGAVHPLTRYVMNYLKYACEYKTTLDLVFHHHHLPFSSQLADLMDLLDANLAAKSKLYKDPALANIFLMNNGRYIAQKIKTSAEIYSLLGETWYRKRSSNLRQYHKNYQRETWAKVLACFKDEGLTAAKGGGVQKPVVKERLKSFNALFEEIHRTQSVWVVSDEQLQSELRVSVSAVVVPAYRSFLGRFGQCLAPGRQTEKYVKFGPEDLEGYIDELFDGKVPAAAARRRT